MREKILFLVYLGYLSHHWMDKMVTIPNKEVLNQYMKAVD
jgi:hypothetical protein